MSSSIRRKALTTRCFGLLGCVAVAYLVVSGPLGWPTVGPQRWTLIWFALATTLLLAAFIAAEELAAVARHRIDDANGARHAVWPATTKAPAGADALITSEDGERFAVLFVTSTGHLEEDSRGRLRDRSGLRRGVSVRRLRRAATRSTAVPVLIATGGCRCRTVEVVTSPDELPGATARAGEAAGGHTSGGLHRDSAPQRTTAAHTGCMHPDARV